MDVRVLGGSGLHKSEVRAVREMERQLRNSWFAYAGLVVSDDQGPMEVDTLIITHDRILLVELKEWNGDLRSSDGKWYIGDQPRGRSPFEIKRTQALRLQQLLSREVQHKLGYYPSVEAHVVLCGTAKPDNLSTSERRYVHDLESFLNIREHEGYNQIVTDRANMTRMFDEYGKPRPNSNEVLPVLQEFFAGPRIKPKELRVHNFIAEDVPWFVHRKNLYIEYKGAHEEVFNKIALIRRWDFNQLGTGHSTQNEWATLGLREQRLVAHVEEHNPRLEGYLLKPVIQSSHSEITEEFVELYELRPTYKRLDEFIYSSGANEPNENRIEHVRALLGPLGELHAMALAHRDLGTHNIWYATEQKSMLLSGFAAAFFPERGTVKDFRTMLQGGSIVTPEQFIDVSEIGDPFREDVFLAGAIAYQICFGMTSVPQDGDGIPYWAAPNNDRFDGALNQWFEKALNWEPENRFTDANAMLNELNASFTPDSGGVDEARDIIGELAERNLIKRGWTPFTLQNEYPAEGEQASGPGGEVRYPCRALGQRAVCRVWFNVQLLPGTPRENRQIEAFFDRVERIRSERVQTPSVLGCGLLETGGLFVVLRWHEGMSWGDYVDSLALFREKAGLADQLISTVQHSHAVGVPHGDLHPGNLLVSVDNGQVDESGGEADQASDGLVVMLDMLDFNRGAETFNTEYGPANPAMADAQARDRYAVYKIVSELLSSDLPEESEVREEIARGFSAKQGVPVDLEALREAIQTERRNWERVSEARAEAPLVTLMAPRPEIPDTPTPVETDDGKYYLRANWDKYRHEWLRCYVQGWDSLVTLVLNVEKRELEDVRYRSNTGLSDLVSASRKADGEIETQIVVGRGKLNSGAVQSLIDEVLNLDSVIDRIVDRYGGATSDEEPAGEEPESDVAVTEIWRALLDAESELAQQVEIASDDISESEDGIVSAPYVIADGVTLDYEANEKVLVRLQGEEEQVGILNVRSTTPDRLAIIPQRGRLERVLRKGMVLELESIESKSSRDKRAAAVNTVLSGGARIPNLADYFSERPPQLKVDASCEPSEQTLRELYDTAESQLNRKQIEAFQYLLSQEPLGALQGPPGTGKTAFIGQLVHYLISSGQARNVLLVGQSHTSVDTAVLKARDVFRQKGESLEVVRLGQEKMIDTSMLDCHSRAQQQRVRHDFHRNYDRRVSAFASRLALPRDFVREVSAMHRGVAPILRTIESYDSELKGARTLASRSVEDGEKLERLQAERQRTVELLERRLEQEFPDNSPGGKSVGEVWPSVVERLCIRHQVNDPRAAQKLTKLLEVSHDWLEVLSTGEARYEKFLVDSRQLVCGTLVGIGRKQYGISESEFDWVIVDEAARAQASELMIALQTAKRAVLVGDHKQLPPHYAKGQVSSAARSLGVADSVVYRTDFERLFRATRGVTLDTQYRMCKPISDLVSSVFYSDEVDELVTGRDEVAGFYASLPQPLNTAATWIDSGAGGDGPNEEEVAYRKFVNRKEVAIVLATLRSLVEADNVAELRGEDPESAKAPVGIITMYRQQRDQIEAELSKAEWAVSIRDLVRVDTVDSYQGQENRIVILSLVRDNPNKVQGFLVHPERINVSVSRAQDRLVVVGATRMWSDGSRKGALSQVLEFIRNRVSEDDSNYAEIDGTAIGVGHDGG